MLISVVVPTRNSARTIRDCLMSIRDSGKSQVEIIVVDNHSTDETRIIASQLADRLEAGGPERSAQRNQGARVAQGDAVVFIDSDMIPEPPLIPDVINAFAWANVETVVIPEVSFGSTFWARCRNLEKELYLGDGAVEAPRAIRKDIFQRLGGYSESLVSGEDWDLGDRLRENGVRFGRVSSRLLHNEGDLNLRRVVSKKYYYGRHFVQYLKRSTPRPRLRFLRLSLVSSPKKLLENPRLAMGLFLMKLAEAFAILGGIAVSGLEELSGRRSNQ